MTLIEEIRMLEEAGILSPECCPQPGYWNWCVRKPDELSDRVRAIYEQYGEIRWYGGE